MDWKTQSDILGLQEVSVVYSGGVVALQPVTLRFRQGELTVLLGQSGAGKSTLLRCLNLLVTPSSGSLWSAELGVVTKGRILRTHRRGIGMIFQQHQLIRRLSALENVMTGRLGYYPWWRSIWPLPPADRELAVHCLDRVGLVDKALRRVSHLSGGEQQRVGIARALCQQPQVLLADEPVASLDPGTARRLLDLLERICKEDGIAIVVSLHQVDLAREYSDRIIGLRAGQILFDDSPDRLTDATLDALYHGQSYPHAVAEARGAELTHA